MEAKKTHRADLQNRRMLFMLIGLCLALGAVVAAFSWGKSEVSVTAMVEDVIAAEQEVIVNTEQQQRPPEVKPQINQVFSDFIDVVRNDTKIDTDYNFDEFSEDFEVVVAPPVVAEEVIEDLPSTSVDEPPTFQGGGLDEFRNWVKSRTPYPQVAAENGIEGTVMLKFVIDREGNLTGIEEFSSPDRSLTEAAIKTLRTSPKWKPGRHMNRPVRVFFMLPIDFQLQN